MAVEVRRPAEGRLPIDRPAMSASGKTGHRADNRRRTDFGPIGDIKIAYSTIWSPRARKRCATVRNDARNSSGSTPSASIRARTGELFGYLVGAAEQAERRSC